MVIEKTLQKLEELINFPCSDDYFDLRIKRYLINFVFRGLKDSNYKLSSSLYRNTGTNRINVEDRILLNFRKYAQILEPRVLNSIWETMILAQHHGAPTRLLDWTYSPLIALHFAIENADTLNGTSKDAAIWALDHNKMNNSLPKQYTDILKRQNGISYTFEMLQELELTIDKYNDDMNNKHLLFFEPPAIDERVVNQYSVFSIMPDSLDPYDDYLYSSEDEIIAFKFIIPKDKLYHFADQLDILNISERTLFPGLDGIASWLRRRYFHRT